MRHWLQLHSLRIFKNAHRSTSWTALMLDIQRIDSYMNYVKHVPWQLQFSRRRRQVTALQVTLDP